jgi:GNAT superfamily N-acetyltransferase
MIRKIEKKDKPVYLEMAKQFYASSAVDHNIPGTHFLDTFDELMRSDCYVSGYILEYKGRPAGYALTAKSFSQEAGGMVLWIDEIFVLPEYRGLDLGHEFFTYIKTTLNGHVKRLRIEAEEDNQQAIALYEKFRFENLPYLQMIHDIKR